MLNLVSRRLVPLAAPKDPSLSSSAPLRDPAAVDDPLLQAGGTRDPTSDEPEPVPTLVRLEVATVSGSS